ncbi:MAG: hypothetical protein KAQ87_02620 [Candidatus Pacebacteria bacterium]|nr:hypothetical protein [Candidatus Paceibacterota bacterium]
MSKQKILILGEFPVFHKGYVEFLNEIKKDKKSLIFFVGILSDEVIKELTSLEIDIRKVPVEDAKQIIDSYISVKEYFSIEKNNFSEVIKNIKPDKIFILQGDKSEDFAERYLLKDDKYKNIIKYHDVRLRWSDDKVQEFKKEASDLPEEELKEHQKFMAEALKEAEKSKCWWRQVGAVAVKDNKIIFRGFNKMLPTEDECYKIGCIRDSIEPGKDPEVCSVTHAEASIISLAARDGVSLKNTILYVTHFPCPACAKLVALAGFKKVVYSRGSSVFDGERVMASRGVDIVKI